MRLTSDNKTCWEDYSEDNSIFIIVIPILSILLVSNIKKCTDYLNYSNNQNHSYQIIIVLLLLLHQVNLLFLISIMKVVVTSLRTRSSLTRQQLQVNKEFFQSRKRLYIHKCLSVCLSVSHKTHQQLEIIIIQHSSFLHFAAFKLFSLL